MRLHADAMRRDMLGSALLAEFSKPGALEAGYGALHRSVRRRLCSVALWARLFSVT
jgi:hypothetical protein